MSRAHLHLRAIAARCRVGADEVARGVREAAERAALEVEIVRTGSRGMYLARAAGRGRDAGRPRRLRAGRRRPTSTACSTPACSTADAHPLRLGPTEDIPFLKRQTRLTFARCGIVDPRSLDDYKAHGG